MTIRAGRLQALLSVTRPVTIDRPDGGQEPGTIDVLVGYPAQVVPISADEQLRLGTQIATATYRAHLRFPKDAAGEVIVIDPSMRATAIHGYTGQVQTFAILKATDVDGRGRELELVLEEQVT